MPPVTRTLFGRQAIKDALPEVSRVRLEQTLLAEYPDLEPYIRKLEREKSTQYVSFQAVHSSARFLFSAFLMRLSWRVVKPSFPRKAIYVLASPPILGPSLGLADKGTERGKPDRPFRQSFQRTRSLSAFQRLPTPSPTSRAILC